MYTHSIIQFDFSLVREKCPDEIKAAEDKHLIFFNPATHLPKWGLKNVGTIFGDRQCSRVAYNDTVARCTKGDMIIHESHKKRHRPINTHENNLQFRVISEIISRDFNY